MRSISSLLKPLQNCLINRFSPSYRVEFYIQLQSLYRMKDHRRQKLYWKGHNGYTEPTRESRRTKTKEITWDWTSITNCLKKCELVVDGLIYPSTEIDSETSGCTSPSLYSRSQSSGLWWILEDIGVVSFINAKSITSLQHQDRQFYKSFIKSKTTNLEMLWFCVIDNLNKKGKQKEVRPILINERSLLRFAFVMLGVRHNLFWIGTWLLKDTILHNEKTHT